MIFCNIVEMRKAHSNFLRSIISRTKMWTASTQFGDIVCNHIETIESLYKQYINNLPPALAKLDELVSDSQELAFHLRGFEALADGMRRTETEDDMKDFTLRGLLHEPVLIVHKYFGLLQGIRKALKSDDPDVAHLGKALAILAPLTLVPVPTMSQSIPQDQDSILDYAVKVANFNEFRKSASKVIKSARKIAEHEAERLHEYTNFADNLNGLQSAYEFSISPELGGALGNYAGLWKRLGDLRSEMHARQKRTFVGPLMADLEAFEKVFGELEKQNAATQAANHEYQRARQKALRDPQGKKLTLELTSHYQKRVLATARREFDTLFDLATTLQEKIITHIHAGLTAQAKFHEQAVSQFSSHQDSIDTMQNYIYSCERARWMKNLYSDIVSAFATPVIGEDGEVNPDSVVVNSGDLDFEWLLKPWPTPVYASPKARFQQISELLALQSLSVINSVAVTSGDDQPRVLETIVRILNYYNFSLDTIKVSVTHEVSATSAPAQLFRTNSISTKLLSAHARVVLSPLVTASLTPLVKEVIANPEGFEVDTTKLKDPSQLDNNVIALILMSQRFLEAIVNEVNSWPSSVKIISTHLAQCVASRFPGSKLKCGVLGGYIFLRFVCPLILTPSSWMACDPPPTAAASRALILITKVIQALANGQEFGAKEAYMKPVNPFVLENAPKLELFFDQLLNSDIIPEKETVNEEGIVSDFHNVHVLTNRNIGKIVKSLYLYGHKEDIPKLVVALVNLGDPHAAH